MESYWEAKAELFRWPGLQAAVINLDDEKGRELSHSLEGGPLAVWTVSCQEPARITAHDVGYDEQGLRFLVREGEETHPLATQLIGQYNVSNLLGVIAAMRALGVPLADAVRACRALLPVPGRMERLQQAGQPIVAIDYAHTPDALDKALLALEPLAKQRGGKLWCVQVQADRAQAIAETIAHSNAADVILVAGKGHEDYQEIAGVKHPFSDKVHAQAALDARSAR